MRAPRVIPTPVTRAARSAPIRAGADPNALSPEVLLMEFYNMTRLLFRMIACFVALLTVPSAFAQSDLVDRFKDFDKDSNGKVTEKETGSNTWKRFSPFDADHDSALSLEEMTTAFAALQCLSKRRALTVAPMSSSKPC